ncbi:MAG: nuclear transport factor 2 family protein [Gemmatimonadaceae bacterium]
MIRMGSILVVTAGICAVTSCSTEAKPGSAVASSVASDSAADPRDAQLLKARDEVWENYFGRPDALAASLSDDFLAINNDGGIWKSKAEILDGARGATKAGVRLVRKEFPQTKIQHFGDMAVIYSRYSFALSSGSEADPAISGRVTQMFRWDGQHWIQVGWHLDSD